MRDLLAEFGDDFDARTALLYLEVRDLGRRIVDIANAWLSEYGITERMLNLLITLYVHRAQGVLSFDVLAARENIPPASLSDALDVLAARGYVTRKAHPADRRRKMIRLTASGRRFLHSVFAFHEDNLERVFTFAERRERDDLVVLLTRLGDAFDRWEAADISATPKRGQTGAGSARSASSTIKRPSVRRT